MIFTKTVLFISIILYSYSMKAQLISALKPYQWEKRIVLVFANSNHDVEFQKQWAVFEENHKGMRERDLLVVGITASEVHSQISAVAASNSTDAFRKFYEIGKAEEVTVILLGKDGTEKLRENKLVLADQLFSLIDSMPMRQQEMPNRPND